MPTRLVAVVPTYNEADALPELLAALDGVAATMAGVDVEVLVVDDNSPDGTGALAEALSYPHLAVAVLHRPAKEGLGRAYVAGLGAVAARDDVDLVVQMDADLSHDPRHLPAMVALATADVDVVVGSRYVPGGSTPDWALLRRVLSQGGNIYARLWLGSVITDHTGGFNMFRRTLLAALPLHDLTADGYGFTLELKHAALTSGARIAQVPITFRDRRHGHSKIPKRTIVENLLLVPRLRRRVGVAGVAAEV